jgi:hypothetical protein
MSEEASGLATQQRSLLALLKDRPLTVGDDAYLDVVRRSKGLAIQRRIAGFWRRFDVERLAPLTSRALTHAGRFEAALAGLERDPDTPPGMAAVAMHLLERHTQDSDPLIAAVASTERALTLVTRGDSTRHEIPWDVDPAPVLGALLAARRPERGAPGAFRIVVDGGLPTLLAIESL